MFYEDTLIDLIENNLNDNELIELNNNFSKEIDNFDKWIYYMEEIEDFLCGYSIIEILIFRNKGEFNIHDSFFGLDNNGFLQSGNVRELMHHPSTIADYIARTRDGLGIGRITTSLEANEKYLQEEEGEV